MKGEGRMASRINRRIFLKTTTAATAGAYAARAIPAWATSDKSLVAVTTPLNTFPYADVQLLDGPMKRQFEVRRSRKSVGLRPATTAPLTKLERTPRLESCVVHDRELRAN